LNPFRRRKKNGMQASVYAGKRVKGVDSPKAWTKASKLIPEELKRVKAKQKKKKRGKKKSNKITKKKKKKLKKKPQTHHYQTKRK